MPPGKLSAQTGHAYTDSLVNALEIKPDAFYSYRNPSKGGSKVTLRAKNQNQLIKAYNLAIDAGIPCALVVDQDHVLPPHFDGSPIITALGIGPCTKEESRHIVKKFRCI